MGVNSQIMEMFGESKDQKKNLESPLEIDWFKNPPSKALQQVAINKSKGKPLLMVCRLHWWDVFKIEKYIKT